MIPAFLLVLTAGVCRSVLITLLPALNQPLLASAIVCWVLAYALFCLCYLRILTSDRADGRPG